MPELNVARYSASSCVLAQNAYVFCGTGIGVQSQLNSIEKLNLEGDDAGKSAEWQLIQPDIEVLSPRSSPIVVPLDENQILILGGNDGPTNYNDAIIFDATSETVQKVKDQDDDNLDFRAAGNPCQVTNSGEICALVNGGSKPYLIQYRQTENIIAILKTY